MKPRVNIITLGVSDVAAGAKFVKTAEQVFWGGYSGYFADPDGHQWEVAHNPFVTLNAQGQLVLL